MLLSWKFYAVLFVILFLSVIVIFHLRKKRAIRLEEEKIANEKFRKRLRKEQKIFDYMNLKPTEMHPSKPAPFYYENESEEYDKFDEEPQEQIKINVDLDKGYYKRKNLNRHEIKYLIEEGYRPFSYKSICTNKKENYILKPRFNESLNHMIVIYDISEYLTKKKIKNNKFTTRMPDIVMYIKGKKIAIEVETGTVMSNMKKFREKLDLLNENYGDDWYFVVTNRNKIKTYRKYGKVIDSRYIRGHLDKIIKNAQK